MLPLPRQHRSTANTGARPVSDADGEKCWATKGTFESPIGFVDYPCNQPGIPPLFLCAEHDAELRGTPGAPTTTNTDGATPRPRTPQPQTTTTPHTGTR